MILALEVVGVVLGLVVLGLIVYLAIPFKRPLLTESDFSHHRTPWWQLNYGHKYLWPRLYAERGSDLESYFGGQSFRFDSEPLEDARTISLRAVGDLMCHPGLLDGGGDHLYDEVGEYIFGGDLRMGNFEFSVNEDRFILKSIRYAVPSTWAEPLIGDERFGRYDFVSLANNHTNDSLGDGIRGTCDFLEREQVLHAGANRTIEERDQFPIVELQGVKIALLAYSFSTNGIPLEKEMPWGLNLVRFNALKDEDYDDSLIREHVELAKKRGADYIVSNHHWGMDHELYPQKRMVERTHRLFECGVDLIIGHHSHLVGTAERYVARDGRECIAIYSLGSLTTFALVFALNRLSQIAEVVLEAGKDSAGEMVVRPRKLVLTPAFHSVAKRAGKVEHRVLAVNRGDEAIRSGKVPAYYTPSDVRHITKLAKLYREHLTYEGVEYR